jgi:hypothetical protein
MTRSPLERARRLRAHLASPGDLWLLLRILALATVLPLLLRTLSLPRLLRWLTPSPVRPGAKAPQPQRIARLVQRVLGLNRWVYRPNCLKRSLLLFHFLRRGGQDVRLHIGVRSPGPLHAGAALDGHAWLELAGAPYLEPQAAAIGSYRVTYRYPERAAADHSP